MEAKTIFSWDDNLLLICSHGEDLFIPRECGKPVH